MAKTLKEVLTSIADKIRQATHEDPNAPAIEEKLSLEDIDSYALNYSYDIIRTVGQGPIFFAR